MSKTPKKPELARLIEFHKFLLKFQAIERHICYVDEGLTKSENDAEHSFSMAMTAWFIASHFPKLDQAKIVQYALVHDLLEVYAGDTPVFGDKKVLASKVEREAKAVKQLAKVWADFPEMNQAIQDYENQVNEEAKFVFALDKIMPIILNIVSEGQAWKMHGIQIEQLHDAKKDKVKAHPEVHDYYQQIYELLQQNSHFFAQKATV